MDSKPTVWTSLWDSYKNIPSEIIMNDPSGKTQRSEFVGFLLKYFDLKGKTILEVGTGTGQYSMELSKRQAICHGIDLEQESIDLVNRISKDLNITGCEFEKIDLFDIKDRHYDIVFSMGTMEHFTETEMKNMLIKMNELGDYVVVGVPYSGSNAYMLSKELSIQMGTWQYGVENDFMSLESLIEYTNMRIIDETTIGAISEAMYLKRLNSVLIRHQMAINFNKMIARKQTGNWLVSMIAKLDTSGIKINNHDNINLQVGNIDLEKKEIFPDGFVKMRRDLACCPEGTGLLIHKATKQGEILNENVVVTLTSAGNLTKIIPIFYTYYRNKE